MGLFLFLSFCLFVCFILLTQTELLEDLVRDEKRATFTPDFDTIQVRDGSIWIN